MSVEPGSVIRVACRMKSNSNKDVVNVYHYGATGAQTAANEDTLAAVAAEMGSIMSAIDAWMPSAYVPYDVKVDKVAWIGGAEQILENIGVSSWGGAFNPAGTGDSYAPAVCILILLRTLIGKSYGRKFLGGLTEAALTYTGLGSGGVIADIADYIARLLNGFTEANSGLIFTPGVLSGSAQHAGEFLPFVEGAVASEPAYQRRRKVNRGS